MASQRKTKYPKKSGARVKSWPPSLMTTCTGCFLALHGQLTRREIDEAWLSALEWTGS